MCISIKVFPVILLFSQLTLLHSLSAQVPHDRMYNAIASSNSLQDMELS